MEMGEVTQIAAVGPDGVGSAALTGEVGEELRDDLPGGRGWGRFVTAGHPRVCCCCDDDRSGRARCGVNEQVVPGLGIVFLG